MANFNVDTNGNLWIGSGVSDTFSTAQGQSNTKFYVTSAGAIYAVSGNIGGIVVDADGVESDNFDASTNTGWRLDNSTGVAQYFDIDIQLSSAASDTPSTGSTTLDIGSTQIYENNDDLFINTSGTSNFVNIRDRLKLTSTSSSGSNMQLMFDGVTQNDAMGFRHVVNGAINSGDADLIWTNQSGASDYNNIAYVTTTDDYFHLGSDAPGIKTDYTGSPTFYFDGPGSPGTDSATFNMAVRPYTIKDKDGDIGSSGQVLSSTGSRIDWIDLPSGNTHPDSDHTSFLTQTTGDSRYVLSSSHSHSSLDNYQKWILKGNGNNLNVLSGYGVEFKAGSGISLSVNTSPYEITFSHGGGTHVSSSTAVQALFPGGIRGSVTLGSQTTGRFFNGIGQSGQNYTWQTTTTFNGNPTFSGTIYVGSHIFHPSANDGVGFIGFSDNRFNRLYASNGVSTTSDERLKENIENIPFGLDYLNTLRPVQFEWIPKYKDECTICGCTVEDGNDNCGNCWEDVTNEEGEIIDKLYCECETTSVDITGNKKLWGFIAQELIETPPEPDIDIELIDYDSESDSYNMNYSQLIAPLVKSVQELSTQISDLTARIEVLEG